MKNIDITEI